MVGSSSMKPGDLVKFIFRFRSQLDEITPEGIGVIIEKHPFSYSHWRVLFPEYGVLDCRASDLVIIS